MYFSFYPHIVLVKGKEICCIYDLSLKKRFTISLRFYNYLVTQINKLDVVEIRVNDTKSELVRNLIEMKLGILSKFKLGIVNFEYDIDCLRQLKIIIRLSNTNYFFLLKDQKYFHRLKLSSVDILLEDSSTFELLDQILSNIQSSMLSSVRIFIDYNTICFKSDKWQELKKRFTIISKIVLYNYCGNQPIGDWYTFTSHGLNEIYDISKVTDENIVLDLHNYFIASKYNVVLANSLYIHSNGCVNNFMGHSFVLGNITKSDLFDIINGAAYKEIISRHKDKILGCKDCDRRYNCLDPSETIFEGRHFKRLSSCKYDI